MQIMIGKLCGGIFKSGIKKTGEPYAFLNFALQTAKGNCFDDMPQTISVPKEKVDSVRAKLLSMPLGSDIMCSVTTEKRMDGGFVHNFQDWFQFPKNV